MNGIEFQKFPKIPRLFRTCVITEKIDGTNAQIKITPDGLVVAGSRNRYITPEDDNHGFAAWVRDHREELLGLGVGTHYGEWYGCGINRNYGLSEKRFALFNTFKWGDCESRPACCGVVPVLFQGEFSEVAVRICLLNLENFGSVAAKGFMKPEGVVVYHEAAGQYFKVTLENDGRPKGATNEAIHVKT